MKLPMIPAILSIVAFAASVAHAAQPAPSHPDPAHQAKITMQHARVLALRARPGTITDQELEREPGGSGLRYSFYITSHGKPFEVGVDAITGTILENVAEGKNPD
jgi:uncharacterized membrane protein YkoI